MARIIKTRNDTFQVQYQKLRSKSLRNDNKNGKIARPGQNVKVGRLIL